MGNTIWPTILAQNRFMKLAQKTDIRWESRAHFYAVADKTTRDLLVDHVHRAQAAKRGGGGNQVTISRIGDANADEMIDVIELEDALRQLGEIAHQQERIVEMRFFAGLSVEDVSKSAECQ